MATIPVTKRTAPSAGGGITGPAISPGAASGIAQTGAGAGKDLLSAALTMKAGFDKAKAGEAFNEYTDASRQKVSELRSLEGANASNALRDYETWETEWRTENSELLQNSSQQRLFGLRMDPYTSSQKDSLAFHAASEHKKYLDSVAVGSVASAQADVVADPFNESIYKQRVDAGVEDILAANPGRDNTGAISKFRASVADVKARAMMLKSPDLAADFIEKEKATLGGAYVPLKEKLHTVQVKQDSQRKADAIMAENPDPEAQLKTARDIEDPEVRDATVSRVKVRHEELKRFTDARNQKIQNGMANGIERAPTMEAAMDIALSAPTQEMSSKLITYAKAVKGMGSKVTDYLELENARAKIDSGEITSIEQLGVEFRSSVGTKWGSLVKYFDEGGNRGQIKDSTLSTSIQFRKKNFNAKKNNNDAQLLQEVREFVEKNLEPGQFPTDKVINDLVSTALMSGEIIGGGMFHDPDGTYIAAFKKGQAATWLPDVTDANEIEEIKGILRENKDLDTEFNVRYYKRVYKLNLPRTPALTAIYEAQRNKDNIGVGP